MASSVKLATFFAIASTASAQYGGYGNGNGGSGYGGYGGSGSDSGYSSGNPYSGSSGSAGDFSSFGSFAGFDVSKAQTIRLAHGVLAALAFVVLFPVGGIIIRVVPSKAAIWIHAGFQVLAYLIYTAAFGLGVWMVREIQFPGFDMLSNSAVNYHPIIGIVIFVVLFFQPILGFMHHLMFKKHHRRQIWSYGHLWIGRIFITLGIINGGL
ncbi:hypothetical protein LTS18_005150, partial [Coniosporium uncinatum]